MKKTILAAITVIVIIYACSPGKKMVVRGEKTVFAEYNGGHKWDITLTLYSDSTFRYTIIRDVMALKTTEYGAYLLGDSSITLYRKRRLSKHNPYESRFRLYDNKVLMYTEAMERSPDSSFYMDYYTLTRIK